MKKLFGTDGIRGRANIEPMTAETAVKLGRAIAYVFKKQPHRHRIVIGKDTRLSGYMLESALMAGVCSMGVDAMIVGPLPTPGIAFITSSMRADAGVVISASHNPYHDNGIKFFSREGLKLSDKLEREIEDFIFNETDPDHIPTEKEVGKAYRIEDAIGRYIVYAKSTFPDELRLDGLKIVVDCANGAGYKVAPEVLYELGAEVISIGVSPNGVNINEDSGALHPENLVAEVKKHKANIGIALDGDADRCILVDEKGNIIDGDHIMAILALGMIKEGTLKNNTLVTTIMSNSALEEVIEGAGGKVVRTDVGDRYVVEEMIKNDYNFGGEQSGHIICLDYTTTGDGTVTSLQILSRMVKENKSLSELASCLKPYPQVLKNIIVKEKKDLDKFPELTAVLKDVESRLDGNGRVFVRYSGTESLARVTIEGKDQKEIEKMAEEIATVIEKELV